jgi:hypothetical protein
MWPSLVKIQYTELKLSCGNDPVVLDNFSSVYWIFNKLCHMIPLWKGKNPIYFGVIRSKVKVTVFINRIFDNGIVSARGNDPVVKNYIYSNSDLDL